MIPSTPMNKMNFNPMPPYHQKKKDLRPSGSDQNTPANTRERDVASFDAMIAHRPLKPPSKARTVTQ